MGQFNPFVGSIFGGGGSGGGSGTNGRSISSITFVSSTEGLSAGIAGATDTYKINYTDGTSTTYVVKNGENGRDGTPGVGIQSIIFTSSSKGNQPNLEGAIDTYTINYTNNTISTFSIYNGENGERILLRVADNAIQYKYETDLSWTNLIFLDELKGDDGDSAYQIAVNNGFSGTEDEWLAGLKGQDGEPGADGTSVNIIDDLASTSELPTSGQSKGDGYLINGELWLYTNSTDSDAINGFKNVGKIQGPAGPKGDSAYQVATKNGFEGSETEWLASLKGEKGEKGDKGNDGTSVNIIDDLASTSDLPASGQNKGDGYLINGDLWVYTGSTDADAINGFKNVGTIQGPAGKGIQSLIINLQGELVVTYTDGVEENLGKVSGENGTNGLSAYEIAVANGFEGSEAEWLTSIKGEKGNDGKGIISIEFKNSSIGVEAAAAQEGATDTYVITYTDETSTEYQVKNGEKGSNGLSAYEIWQGLGNTGTEQEFVNSLKGTSIQSIMFTSSSIGNEPNIAGAIDTYTITLTDGSTSTFTIYNGTNGGGSGIVAVDTEISETSENPVQNKVIKIYIDEIVGNIQAVLDAIINGGSGTVKAPCNLTLSSTEIVLNGSTPEGTVTISKEGDGVVTLESSDTSIATATIVDNTITITAIAEGTATITVSVAESDNYLGATETIDVTATDMVHIYGVSWDGTEPTSWTRTDDAAGFADPVPYVSGASNYGSPFDGLQPWAGMTKSERTGGTMVSIPKFWYKLSQNGNGMSIQIADKATEGFHVSPAHMDRGDGKGERDIVYVARYHCGASTGKSKTGELPKVKETRSNARSRIHGYGTNIWQRDKAMSFTLQLLYLVEFADWNSQAKVGKGCGNNSAVEAMGYTDSMPYHTGTTLSSRDTYGCGTQYRNIEGLWDNCFDWEDGGYNNSNGYNFILNPANFSDSSGGVVIGTPSNGWPSKFAVKDISGAFPMFIPTEKNGSETTFSCDYWYFNASYPCVCVGGNYSQDGHRGLFYVYYNSASNTNGGHGSRLQELP